VSYLKAQGHYLRGVDLKEPEYEPNKVDEFYFRDLRNPLDSSVFEGIDEVYALAANMGGIGFIESHKAEIVRDNTLINLNSIENAYRHGVRRFLFTSSACVYPSYLQSETDAPNLKEEDAYPADAEDGYGWEKLYFERVCRHYREDYGLDTRIVRFHNIFGPLGTYDGGREKSPAAICRKIALATDGDEIEVWGDGKQTRSYCYIDDCVEGLYRLMNSDYTEPLNLGQDRLISIDELVDIVSGIAGKAVKKVYDLSKPQGVRGRNSDNTKLREVLNWEPNISLEEGLRRTYEWIESQVVVPA
jgi:nucleoside-diphosphate-sugar epimerase